ncbi:MAG: DUF3150 domain-containing protein [Proteobacteria bacterium]|nr:DUF3150 domain-containing protein [Pseudomonadota bacterium]
MVEITDEIGEELFEKGQLLTLQFKAWEARKKIDQDKVTAGDADKDMYDARKSLIDRDRSIAPIRNARVRATTYVESMMLPGFPYKGAYFIPKEQMIKVAARLERFREQWEEAVDWLVDNYEELKAEAKPRLGSLYNEDDYPTDIRERFQFSWQFWTMEVPIAGAPVYAGLDREFFEGEKKKHQDMLTEFRVSAMTELRAAFKKAVDHLVDLLIGRSATGKKKVIRLDALEKLHERLEYWEQINIYDDAELNKELARMRSLVGGIDVRSLRNDESFRDEIARTVGKVQDTIDKDWVEDAPKRRIITRTKAENGKD